MFNGIRFVLIGFDSVSEAQYRSELVNSGGIDVGRYDSSCSHVIVHGRIYDDPVCVAARRDGKTIVTELWVEDSLDIGQVADARRILYRPVKDLKGIPGAESLHICLTGYQKQNRDDIMKMVDLMGAQFSKPLIAAKVTHLVCYKFEGEKYELARRIGKNLVNHRWLEDCLKSWEILPVDNYNKSSWELELMAAEARDSEEETEPDVGGLSNLNGGSGTLIPSSELPTPVREVPKILQDMSTMKGSPYTTEDISARNNRLLSSPFKGTNPDKASGLGDFDDKGLEEFGYMDASSHAREVNGRAASSARVCQDVSFPSYRSVELNKEETKSSSKSKTAKRSPHSEGSVEKSSAISYSRKIPRKSMSSFPELSDHSGSPQGQLGEKAAVDVLNSSLLTSKQTESDLKTAEIQIPIVSTEKHHKEELSDALPQRRNVTVLRTALRSPNKGDWSATTAHRSSEVDPTSMIIDAPPSNVDRLLNNNHPLDVVNAVNQLTNEHVGPSKTKSLSITKKSGKHMQPVLRNKTSENSGSQLDRKVRDSPCHIEPSHMLDKQTTISDATNYSGAAAIKSRSAAETDTMNCLDLDAMAVNGRSTVESSLKEKMPETSLGIKANNDDIKLSRSPNRLVSRIGEPQKLPQDDMSSPNRKTGNVEKMQNAANSSPLKGRIDSASSGKLRKKLVAKKNMGSRPKPSTSNTSKGNHNYKDKTVTSDDLEESNEGAELVKTVSDDNAEMPVELASKASDVTLEDRTPHSVNKTKIETSAMDKKETLVDVEKEKRPNMDGSNSDVIMAEETRRSVNGTKRKTSAVDTKETFVDVQKEKNPTVDKSNSIALNAVMKKKGKGIQFSVNKMSTASAVDEKETSMDLGKENKPTVGESTLKESSVVTGKLKGMRRPANKTMSRTSTVDNKEKSMDAEKENRPTENGGLSVNLDEHVNQEATVKSIKKPMRNEVVGGTDVGGLHASTGSREVNSEPVWFILSGHRLQRKEFQQVIRRLRGRVCRDSHHWSYQATHFIVPDPVRRTEKFFAAAAAGRWILKMDYLTASNQAGRFFTEEPFEWYKRGLSEDGAISLEAPRKWRLLRERTGHGAFYGMRILIYGDCVAPSLDTLKRVVKAGDGVILATSPPYSRFLKSGVDFAIISPGLPHVDCWVQEFLRHEIPCIVADYLVEYVCKPGYSLERHVLYKTHAWAEKSCMNLLTRTEEVVQTLTSSEDDEDLACVVCGSHDRGDVMLICGDEGGSVGCGMGTHIDCCDPPLEVVPQEDWFCSKCRSRMITPIKGTKKASSLKKRK